MSFPGNQVGLQGLPTYASQLNTSPNPPRKIYSGGMNHFDQFQRSLTEANTPVSKAERMRLFLFHPVISLRMRKHPAPVEANEDPTQQVKMYAVLHKSLNSKGKRQLKALLSEGVLSTADTDNQHTTLYQLYSMLTTPRSPGYDAKSLVQEAVGILHQPYTITQKFEPLSENAAQQLLDNQNNNWQAYPQNPQKQLTFSDLNVDNSATCVSSSVMYYMADKKPGELARHLNELTSPLNAFHEKVKLSELSPDNPQQAFEILKQHHIPYYVSGPDEVTVKIDNPPAGIIRAMDSQDVPTGGRYRNALEAAYQSALTHLATSSYDPATDLRDSEVPGETSKGLTEDEKTLMETIIKDNGGVQSITYQVVNGKANPQPGEEGNAYLYGYTRSFNQTANDMLASLKMGEPIIIGITDTDADGSIVGGHEITITGATTDPKTGELKFVVADSDDDVPSLVVRSARELIPRIHHAGMPLKIAQQINQEITTNNGYLVPDDTDAAQFQLMARQTGPFPQDGPPPQDGAPPVEPPAQLQAANGTAPVVSWMPAAAANPGVSPFATSATGANQRQLAG